MNWLYQVFIHPIHMLHSSLKKEKPSLDDFQISASNEIKDLSQLVGKSIIDLNETNQSLKMANEESNLAKARFKNIMDTVGDCIVCTDHQGIILEMNPSFVRLTGINKDDKEQLNIQNFIPDFKINPLEEEYNSKFICFQDSILFDSQKNETPVEISTNSFLSSENEKLFTVIIRDMTDRAQLMEQLLQAQKLESIGLLAAGISHEINTPAQYIMDYNSFLKDGFETVEKFLKKVHEINHPQLNKIAEDINLEFYEAEIPNAINGSLFGLEQISKIIKSVKGFTHPESTDKTFYNINDIIQDAVNVSRNEWKYHCELNLALDEQLPNIKCFPTRLNQVFLNLIINSAQAIQEKKKTLDLTEKGSINISSIQIGGNIVISLSDTGCGMCKETQMKAFDPFFTTKEVGVGTGQGLALAYDFIVTKHEGKIDLKSIEGEGSEFTITLPIQ
ncbi:MAG: ATP-binding protein [Lentisphaerales bacterium]|nr:ATP-binding protein [Lentisphaerales bacterium]